MRFTNIATFEKELNQKIDENIRIKTTVDVLRKRLYKERRMIHRRSPNKTNLTPMAMTWASICRIRSR